MDPQQVAASDVHKCLTEAAAIFRQQFGSQAAWAACAPGRVNLIGEHVDYNQGFVLPMAIGLHTVVVAGRPPSPAAGSDETQIYSMNLQELRALPRSGDAPIQPGWPSYIQGVLAGYQQRGIDPGPLRMVINSSVPLGGGLSSSASLEVAVATLVESITGTALEPLAKVRLCQAAEHDYAGVPCGMMDQFAIVSAEPNQLMLLDCRSLQAKGIVLAPPAPAILIVNSNVRHALGESEYAVRRRECEQACASLGVESLRDVSMATLHGDESRMDPTVYRRARHVISEIERTRQAASAIEASDWRRAGELMYASHRSLSEDYAVSCPELDLLVQLAQQLGISSGVYGCRMTGGGFGGCTVSLVDTELAEKIARSLQADYLRLTGIEPTWLLTRPAAGARPLSASISKTEIK